MAESIIIFIRPLNRAKGEQTSSHSPKVAANCQLIAKRANGFFLIFILKNRLIRPNCSIIVIFCHFGRMR